MRQTESDPCPRVKSDYRITVNIGRQRGFRPALCRSDLLLSHAQWRRTTLLKPGFPLSQEPSERCTANFYSSISCRSVKNA